jgi:hypothetical protein
MKIYPVEAELFPDYGQTDMKLIVSFTELVQCANRLSQSRSVCDMRVYRCRRRVAVALKSYRKYRPACERSESFVSDMIVMCARFSSGQKNRLTHLRLAYS